MSKAKRNQTRTYWILGIALLVLLAIAIWQAKNKKHGEEVEVTEVERRDLVERVSASGKIFPETEVKISSDVSGEIVALLVKEGDSVKRGQELLRIDPEVLASAVERGSAAVDNARAQLDVSKSNIESAKAQMAQIQAQVDNAQLVFDRNSQLFKDGIISRQELESSQANLDGLKANLASAAASVAAAEQTADAARYTMQSQRASLKELNTNLKRTTIYAPSDGVVSSLLVEQGERVVGTIQMTGTEIMRIANFASMEAQVEVNENDILNVKLGQETDVELDAFGDRKFKGQVSEIANSASNVTMGASLATDQVTNFIVKIRLDPGSYADLIGGSGSSFPLRPGLSASADIMTNTAQDQLAVPIEAVTARDKDSKRNKRRGKDDDNEEDVAKEDLQEVVFVVKGDTVAMQPVETGIQDEDYIVIKSGLAKGDVVVRGPYKAVAKKLSTGDEIHVKEEDDED